MNCAGIAPPAKVLDRDGNPDVARRTSRSIIRINLIGTYNVIAQASAVMARTEPDGRRRPRRHRQHRERRRVRRPDRPARVLGEQGRRARDDAARRPRARPLRHPRLHDRPRHHGDADAQGPAAGGAGLARRAGAATPRGSAGPTSMPLWSCPSSTTATSTARPSASTARSAWRRDDRGSLTDRTERQFAMSRATRSSSRVEDGLARITLNRPVPATQWTSTIGWPHAGARSPSRRRRATTSRAILLDAEGRDFCAGGDVIAMARRAPRAPTSPQLAGTSSTPASARSPTRRQARSSPRCRAPSPGEASASCSPATTSSSARTRASSASTRTSASPPTCRRLGAARRRPIGQRRALQLAAAGPHARGRRRRSTGVSSPRSSPRDEVRRPRRGGRRGSGSTTRRAAYGQAKRLVRDGAERTFAEKLADEARRSAPRSTPPSPGPRRGLRRGIRQSKQ